MRTLVSIGAWASGTRQRCNAIPDVTGAVHGRQTGPTARPQQCARNAAAIQCRFARGGAVMPADPPYSIPLDPKFGPLELIDLQPLADACTHPWFNQTLCRVNGSVVRLGVLQ